MNSVLDYLEVSAGKLSNKKAVVVNDEFVTYGQLKERSRRIGTALSEKAISGLPVGVFCQKGITALYAFFGTVYAGGCYCFMNTALPDNRLLQIQSVLKANIILTDDNYKDRAEKLFPECKVILIEELLKTQADDNVLSRIRNDFTDTDPLYINFTSGSTGIPKGIAVSHRSVIDFIKYFTEIFRITESDIIANQAPFDFDVSVKDIYSAISAGATLVVIPSELFMKPMELLEYLCRNKITTMIWAVSALCLISTFHALDYKLPDSVSKILFSGEVMPYKHLCYWRGHFPDAMFVNLYGPTEITCNCTYHILKKGEDYADGIPIGKHFPNEDVFLLDSNNRKVLTKDTIGEIYVRGTALALGYYNNAEKNTLAFIQNPLHNAYPELVYKTGDLAKYNAHNDLVFCGRTDNQIKHMGHRIELEEVEKNISEIDGVERCICIYDKEKSKLKAFYIGCMEKKELHLILKQTMPVYMIPGFIRQVGELPLNKNGKIDRKLLSEMC